MVLHVLGALSAAQEIEHRNLCGPQWSAIKHETELRNLIESGDVNMYRYREAVKRAGIAWVTWHDLRHCFASRLAMSNAPLGTIAAMLRHSTTALVKRYAHLSPSHLPDAVEMVSVFGRARKPDHEEQLHNGTVSE